MPEENAIITRNWIISLIIEQMISKKSATKIVNVQLNSKVTFGEIEGISALSEDNLLYVTIQRFYKNVESFAKFNGVY